MITCEVQAAPTLEQTAEPFLTLQAPFRLYVDTSLPRDAIVSEYGTFGNVLVVWVGVLADIDIRWSMMLMEDDK